MTAVSQSPVSISRRALDIEDYIDIARRHVSWIIGPLYAGIVISTMVAFFLPNTYVSRAMLRITPSQIPENLVPSTFNQQMSDRIQQMWQEITSRNSLSELIQRPTLNLYPSQRNNKPLDDVIEDMKNKDIKIDVLGLQQTIGKPASAFVVSFTYPDRFKAQLVTNALVSKFSDANNTVQRTGVIQTQDLIKDELTNAKTDLDRLNGEITTFKMANAGRLPEQLSINANTMMSLQTSLASVNEALSRIQQNKLMQETSLSTLETQYSSAESALSVSPEESAPAAIAKNEEIAQLKRDISANEQRLAVMRQTLTEQHPDIVDFKASLATSKKRLDDLEKEDARNQTAQASKPKSSGARKPTNYQAQDQLIRLKGNIDSTKAALQGLEMEKGDRLRQQERLQKELQIYQARIESSPANEQKYASLLSEQRMASARYEDLQHKQQLAAQGIEVQTRKAGENLDVLDPASLPETPTAPNRWQIVGIGAFAGLLIGITLAGVREMRDTSLKNLKDVRAYTNLPVLSSIPLLENAVLVRRKRSLAYVGWAVAVILGMLGTAISLYYHFTTQR